MDQRFFAAQFSSYYYAANDGANAQNIEAEGIARQSVTWQRRGAEEVQKG